MNKAIEIGRLTRDPEVRYSQGNNTAVARYTIAVDRKFKREGEQTADFKGNIRGGVQSVRRRGCEEQRIQMVRN